MLLNKFEMEGFMAQKGLWNFSTNRALQDRGALPKEKGMPSESMRQCMKKTSLAVGSGKIGKVKTKEDKEVREDEGKKSGREKEEHETVVKRNCVNSVSVEAFDISSQGTISECDSECSSVAESGKWSSALVSYDIYVPPSFAVEVVGVGEMSDSGWEFGSECGSVDMSGVLVVPDVGEAASSVVTDLWWCAFGLCVGFCRTTVLFFFQET